MTLSFREPTETCNYTQMCRFLSQELRENRGHFIALTALGPPPAVRTSLRRKFQIFTHRFTHLSISRPSFDRQWHLEWRGNRPTNQPSEFHLGHSRLDPLFSFLGEADCPLEILALKHESRILGKWSNPVSGSRMSQASSPWAKQHSV